MLNIKSDSKIYVYCPAGVVTGGAELLHQLVHILNNNALNAYIVYFGEREHIVPADYKNYNIKISEHIENSASNIEVIYEGRFDFVRENTHTQKLLWWLSVDNFFICSMPFLSIIDIFKFNKRMGIAATIHQIKRLIFNNDTRCLNSLSIKELRDMNAINGYQSEYAQNFLQNKGFKEMMPLKDYINTEHQYDGDATQKKNIVLYNPKKGYEFTRRIIKASPQFKWIPLQGMSRTQLIKTIKEAKVYIDFGYHPGKDRLPRECAINGCCIITGTRGSAGFYEDVALPRKYKFVDKTSEINNIIKTIEYIFDNYSSAIDDFKTYRKFIISEKEEFEKQVANIFGY